MRSFETNPVVITKKVAIGISKAKPKAKKALIQNLNIYLCLS